MPACADGRRLSCAAMRVTCGQSKVSEPTSPILLLCTLYSARTTLFFVALVIRRRLVLPLKFAPARLVPTIRAGTYHS